MRTGNPTLALLRRWPVIILCVILAAVGGASYLLSATPTYSARASVFFAVQGASSGADLAQGGAYTSKQIASYAQIAESPYVLSPVIARSGLSTTPATLAQKLTATAPDQSSVLQLTFSSSDPQAAADILNSIANQLVKTVSDLSPSASRKQAQVKATLIAPAEVPTAPSSPNVPVTLIGALIIGLTVGVLLAFVRVMTDTRIRTEEDLHEVGATPVVGRIPVEKSASDQPVALWRSPHGPRAEAYRRLRTNLHFLTHPERDRTVVITSSVPGEGKSTTAVNLAASIAEAGESVVLLDCDLRRPRLAELLGLDGTAGLTSALLQPDLTLDLVQPVADNLDVLTSGPIPPNPSELLGSQRMVELLATLVAHYEFVILDSPPLLPVTDASLLSSICGGTLLVAGAGTVRKPHVRSSLRDLEAVDASTMGVVLNKVRLARHDPYRYGYGNNGQSDGRKTSA